MPEEELDILSVAEAALLPRLIGWGRTSWLLYRGDAIDARTAEDWGLIEKVVPAEILDGAIEECSKNSLPTEPPVYVFKKTHAKMGK